MVDTYAVKHLVILIVQHYEYITDIWIPIALSMVLDLGCANVSIDGTDYKTSKDYINHLL